MQRKRPFRRKVRQRTLHGDFLYTETNAWWWLLVILGTFVGLLLPFVPVDSTDERLRNLLIAGGCLLAAGLAYGLIKLGDHRAASGKTGGPVLFIITSDDIEFYGRVGQLLQVWPLANIEVEVEPGRFGKLTLHHPGKVSRTYRQSDLIEPVTRIHSEITDAQARRAVRYE